MTKSEYWCELAWLGGQVAERGVVIGVSDGVITDLTTGHDRAPAGAAVLAGITLPAFANTHSHAFHRAVRSRTHREGSFWSWRDLMYRAAAQLEPGNYYYLARATFAEMALAGIGVVGEFHYVHHQPDGSPYADPNEMGRALVAAAESVGIRLTLLDTVYLSGGLEGGGQSLSEQQLRFGDGSVAAWQERADTAEQAFSGPRTRLGAAVHSIRAVDPDSIAAVADWAERRSAPLHVHVSEQPLENTQSIEAYGRTPLEVLADAGALGPLTTAIHATHLSAGDIKLLAQSGASVCLCPTTERDLADGTGPSKALSEAGVALCVGSDSHAVIDPLEEVRSIELNQRAATLQRGVHTSTELLTAATTAGYRALGWHEGGTLDAGAPADFTTISRTSVRLSGSADEHALDAVVFAANAADVDNVVIAGRTVVCDGSHVDLDVGAELEKAIAAVLP